MMSTVAAEALEIVRKHYVIFNTAEHFREVSYSFQNDSIDKLCIQPYHNTEEKLASLVLHCRAA